jgi:hypothetical protein
MNINTLSQFFKFNLIALRLNQSYKLNRYLLLFIFLCIISSIIFRASAHLIVFIESFQFLILPIFICTSIYSLKLISDLIIRIIQAYKIIPEFYHLYKNNEVDGIKSIISLYYLQNIFFITLSCWILYIIFIKLNIFVPSVYLLIIYFGILSSITFIVLYPNLFTFKIEESASEVKMYSLWLYLLLIFFILFYMFIFPLTIIKIVNSDKFIHFF